MLLCFVRCSGIKTNIGTINTWRYWGVVLALIGLATVAKFVPACLTSKLLLRERSWRFCSALGLMMNTRGLVEMIALNIGLDMVRDPTGQGWGGRGVTQCDHNSVPHTHWRCVLIGCEAEWCWVAVGAGY